MGTLPNTLVGLPGRAPGDLSRTCTSSFVLAVLPLPCLDEGEGSVCVCVCNVYDFGSRSVLLWLCSSIRAGTN